eukprot:1458806-Rhodomonas_salina.3
MRGHQIRLRGTELAYEIGLHGTELAHAVTVRYAGVLVGVRVCGTELAYTIASRCAYGATRCAY